GARRRGAERESGEPAPLRAGRGRLGRGRSPGIGEPAGDGSGLARAPGAALCGGGKGGGADRHRLERRGGRGRGEALLGAVLGPPFGGRGPARGGGDGGLRGRAPGVWKDREGPPPSRLTSLSFALAKALRASLLGEDAVG